MGWKPRKGLAHREIDGAVYIVDSAASRLHRLNETGSFVWKAMAAGRPAAEIAFGLAAEFEVDGRTASADVEEFVAGLEKAGLLERSL
jgi:hypothetical protein